MAAIETMQRDLDLGMKDVVKMTVIPGGVVLKIAAMSAGRSTTTDPEETSTALVSLLHRCWSNPNVRRGRDLS